MACFMTMIQSAAIRNASSHPSFDTVHINSSQHIHPGRIANHQSLIAAPMSPAFSPTKIPLNTQLGETLKGTARKTKPAPTTTIHADCNPAKAIPKQPSPWPATM